LCEYYALADNFQLSPSKQPNFDYPQMHKYQKLSHQIIFFAFILEQRAFCVKNKKHKFASRITKKAYPRSYCYLRRFFV